jgi:hypothetical protein
MVGLSSARVFRAGEHRRSNENGSYRSDETFAGNHLFARIDRASYRTSIAEGSKSTTSAVYPPGRMAVVGAHRGAGRAMSRAGGRWGYVVIWRKLTYQGLLAHLLADVPWGLSSYTHLGTPKYRNLDNPQAGRRRVESLWEALLFGQRCHPVRMDDARDAHVPFLGTKTGCTALSDHPGAT